MRNADCSGIGYQARREGYFFDFGRTHTIARGLDHLVAAPDEVQIAILVHTHCIARPDGELRRHQTGRPARHRFVALGGLLRIVPVAERHERAAMHELPRLIRSTDAAIRPDDQDLGIGNGFPDGAGTAVNLGRGQIAGAESLGQPIHQEDLSRGHGAAQFLQCCPGHRATGVRNVAQRRDGLAGPWQLGELRPERWHARQACDPLLRHQSDDVPGKEVIHEHDAGADRERRGQLAEAIVEAEGQHRQQTILGTVLQVLSDASSTGHQVAMREDHTLRTAGAARGVKDCGHIHVDDPVIARRVARPKQLGPRRDVQAGRHWRS